MIRLILCAVIAMMTMLPLRANLVKTYDSSLISNNTVTSLAQDKEGYMWIGTIYGLNRFDGVHVNMYTHHAGDSLSLSNNHVSRLYVAHDGTLWVGTVNGLNYYDSQTNSFRHVLLYDDAARQPHISSIVETTTKDGAQQLLVATSGYGMYTITRTASGAYKAARCERYKQKSNDDFYYIYLDRHQRLWKIDNKNVVTCFNLDGRLLYHTICTMGDVIQFIDDAQGNVVVMCKYGLMRYEKTSNGKWTMKNLGSFSDGCILSAALLNKKKELIIGTYGKGLMTLQSDGQLTPRTIQTDKVDFSNSDISDLVEDNQGNLWVGLGNRGLAFVSSLQAMFVTEVLQKSGTAMSCSPTSMCNDKKGNRYVTVNGLGLFVRRRNRQIEPLVTGLLPQLVYCDSNDRLWMTAGMNLYRLQPDGQSQQALKVDCNIIPAIVDDNQGNLYLSAFSKGMVVYHLATGDTTTYSMYKYDKVHGRLVNDWIFSMFRDSRGYIWIGTTSGLCCYDPRKDSFRPFGWDNQLEGKGVNSFAEDGEGNIIIGTSSGIYRYERRTNKVSLYPESDDLRDLQVCYVAYTRQGGLWCSTSMGIWHYEKGNDGKNRWISFVNGTGLTSHEYLQSVGAVSDDGWMAFGTPFGTVVFNPKYLSNTSLQVSHPQLTGVLVDGELEALSGNKVTMDYDRNTFQLQFSSFDYARIDDVTLEYRLDEEHWHQMQAGRHTVIFTHLQPGRYHLYVRYNRHGQYSVQSDIIIVVRPPWYASEVAYICYTILLLTLAYFVYRHILRRRRQQLDEEKMQFLINATHDIRTPLTLILNPLQRLVSSVNDEQQRQLLLTIQRNAARMAQLVNQILDVRKIDKVKSILRCQQVGLAGIINDSLRTFEYDARERGIQLSFDAPKPVEAWVDRIQMDKVITNLLSNAFKYTHDGGHIRVTLSQRDDKAVITVEDDGNGLKPGDEKLIFRRFYQSQAETAVKSNGTGIGLNLCRMIVEMHHGTIAARNKTAEEGGLGAVFTIVIPTGRELLSPDEIVEDDKNKNSNTQLSLLYHILFVDDDEELTDYIQQELSRRYRLTICHNGKQAIGELLAHPDKYQVVVSDIMMPEMDGFTLLRLIKSNPIVHHLPVVMLTSEAAIGNRLEGLDKGADAFMAKPFMMEELKATIDSLILNRQKMRGHFDVVKHKVETVEKQAPVDYDKVLMDKIMKSIDDHISESDFDVEMLCKDVGVSRTQLHRKMKQMTGLSTTEFIRNIRLEQAGRLLRERHINVSEVAYSVGFANTSHFSQVFKKHFGVSPTEYGDA